MNNIDEEKHVVRRSNVNAAENMKLIGFGLLVVFHCVQPFENDTLDYDNTTVASKRTKQITRILDGLLEDYQAHIRPNFGGKSITR